MQNNFEVMGGTYHQEGGYLLPDLEVPETPQLGIWGERRRKYLREHQKALYTAMMLSDTLNAHLEEVDQSATALHNRITLQLAEQEGVTEQLKATDQMEWVRRMHSIHNRAVEIVRRELICV